MVKIALQIKANLESVEKLYTNHPHYQWFLKLKCGSCGEVSEKFHDLTEAEKVPQKHNRSETNLLIKCKLCSRENSIDVIEGSNGQYTSNDQGKFKTIVTFDCRGVEPVDFEPKSGWIAEAEDDGKKFEDVDLTEKEWVDYDEKNQTSVGVYELEWQFIKVNISIQEKDKKSQILWNKDLQKKRKLARRLLRKALKKDDSASWEEYRKARNIMRNTCRREKKKSIKALAKHTTCTQGNIRKEGDLMLAAAVAVTSPAHCLNK